MKRLFRHIAIGLAVFSSAILISGCKAMDVPQLAKNAHLPLPKTNYADETIDDYVIDVNGNQIKTLIDSRASFLLYIGNDYCSSCLAFKEAFLGYIMEADLLVYKFDNIANYGDYQTMIVNHPDVFPEYPVTPSLYFFKDGELRTRQDGNTRMFELATLRPIMKSYADVINVKAIHDEMIIDSLLNEDGVFILYDRNSLDLLDFYNLTLFPYIVKNNTSIFQIEISLNSSLLPIVNTSLNLPETTPTLFTVASGTLVSSASLLDYSHQQLLDYYITSLSALN